MTRPKLSSGSRESRHVNQPTASDAIATYILAKDSNQPKLMERAFAEDCELGMAVNTDAISFPGSARGLAEVTRVLVTNFADQYQNVRTFCFSRPHSDYLPHFDCDWLVGMSARQGGAVRVGCGRYDWHFASGADKLVKKLSIEIDVMCVLPAEALAPVMAWLSALPYPWCSRTHASDSAPAIEALHPIKDFLGRLPQRT